MREEMQGPDASIVAGKSAAPLVVTRRGIGIEQVWIILPVLLIIYKGFMFPLPPLDFWWHLKMGEVIATTGSIPRVDSFSFTAAGQPFVVQNWLGELIYYWTYRAGGFPLLICLATAITAAGFLLMYQLCRRATGNMRLVALIGFLAALGNYGFLRPQTYSFLFFSAFYFVLERYRRERKDTLWMLPVGMALWVNLHGAFIMGLGLLGLYIATECCRRVIDPARNDALSATEIRKLSGVLLVCILATFLNPEGLRIYEYVRTVVTDAGSQQLVAEWKAPRVTDFLGFLVFYCPFFLTVFTFIYARIKPDLTEVGLFLAFAVLGLISIRNAPWFSTIAFPLLARYAPFVDLGFLYPLRRYKLVDQFFNSGGASRESASYGRINALLLAGALLILATQSPWIRPRLTGGSLFADQTPVGAADFIEQRGLTGRIFHPQMFGDYLIWRLWPQQKSFVDGRVHLFGLDFLNEYERALKDPLSTDLLDRWKIQYVLLSKQANLKAIQSLESSGAWTRLYQDNISELFERESR